MHIRSSDVHAVVMVWGDKVLEAKSGSKTNASKNMVRHSITRIYNKIYKTRGGIY